MVIILTPPKVGWLPLLLMLAIGAALSIAGFMIMRNPFLICRMPFTRRGYYERLFLDTTERNQFRGMSGCMSLFGILMLLSASQVFLKSSVVSALTTAFFETLFVVVMGVCVTGMVLLVVDLVRGRLLKKFVTFWKPMFAAPKPEECPVLPEITPKMKREAMIFTIGFVGTVLVGIISAITRKP